MRSQSQIQTGLMQTVVFADVVRALLAEQHKSAHPTDSHDSLKPHTVAPVRDAAENNSHSETFAIINVLMVVRRRIFVERHAFEGGIDEEHDHISPASAAILPVDCWIDSRQGVSARHDDRRSILWATWALVQKTYTLPEDRD